MSKNESPSPPERSAQRFQICICDGPSCGMTFESERLRDLFEERIKADPDYARRLSVYDYNCFGRCGEGPNMFVQQLAEGEAPGNEPDIEVLTAQRGFYPGMDEAKCERVLAEHCGRGKPVKDLVDEY